jgi:hypothetical protein
MPIRRSSLKLLLERIDPSFPLLSALWHFAANTGTRVINYQSCCAAKFTREIRIGSDNDGPLKINARTSDLPKLFRRGKDPLVLAQNLFSSNH